jgi:hypothetical protein
LRQFGADIGLIDDGADLRSDLVGAIGIDRCCRFGLVEPCAGTLTRPSDHPTTSVRRGFYAEPIKA